MWKKVWKKIIIVLICLLVVAGVAVFVFFKQLDNIIAAGITKFGTDATGTKVTVEKVSFEPFNGNLALVGLKIDNPKDCINKEAFKFDKFAVDVDPDTVFKDKIVINSISIDNIAIDYEPGMDGSNLKKIEDNIKKYTGADKPAEKAPAETKEETKPAEPGKKKTVVIKKFIINGGEISVSSSLLKQSVSLKMKEFELNDIGTDKEMDAEEVLMLVYSKLLPLIIDTVATSTESALKQLPLDSSSLDDVKTGVEKGIDKIKSLF
jgi:hypothetical protein